MLSERCELRLQTFSIDSIISTPLDWPKTTLFTSTTAKPSRIVIETRHQLL
jgi:hypothetical protein